MADWWNTSYSLRRNIRFNPSTDLEIGAGYPLTISFNYNVLINSNKVRPDFADIAIIHWNGTTSTPVPREISIVGEDVFIQFNAVAPITVTNTDYYVYMANASMYNAPTVAEYVPADYVIDTSDTSGVGLSYTRPTEDWINGVSTTDNARASFMFFGINARLVVEKGPNRGILELIIDNQNPVEIDCYAATVSQQPVYSTSGLALARHNIRMRVTGSKNQASIGSSVKIVKFEYSKYVLGIDLGEELNPSLNPLRIYVGP
jgi:hypothetical protein